MKITLDHLKVFLFVKERTTRWFDIKQVAHHTGVHPWVVSRCLLNLTKEGILLRNELFRSHIYHLAEGYEKVPLWDLIVAAIPIFGYQRKAGQLEEVR